MSSQWSTTHGGVVFLGRWTHVRLGAVGFGPVTLFTRNRRSHDPLMFEGRALRPRDAKAGLPLFGSGPRNVLVEAVHFDRDPDRLVRFKPFRAALRSARRTSPSELPIAARVQPMSATPFYHRASRDGLSGPGIVPLILDRLGARRHTPDETATKTGGVARGLARCTRPPLKDGASTPPSRGARYYRNRRKPGCLGLLSRRTTGSPPSVP